MSAPTISACLIVKDAQRTLATALDSLTWCDEIIVLDSGSCDDTVQIARRYTDHVYINTDWQGFGIQRQRVQDYATGDWILVIDADEYVSPQLRDNIQHRLKLPAGATCFKINRLSTAFGETIRHGGWHPDWLVRLYLRRVMQYSNDAVHEKVLVPANFFCEKLSGLLYHDTYQSLHHYLRKVNGYLETWTDARANQKKVAFFSAITHGFWSFIRQYFLQLGFLDGRVGFILASLTSYSSFIKYTDLWLRQHSEIDQQDVDLTRKHRRSDRNPPSR